MYLKELYHHNKYWFAVVLVFILCQLFINFKRGMVVSPFYHYGMYSGLMKPDSSYTVLEIIADGEVLRTKDYNAQQWDKIMQPVLYYSKHKKWNAGMFIELNRITGISDTAKYVSTLQKKEFFDHYRKYLSIVIDKKVRTLTVQQKTFIPGE